MRSKTNENKELGKRPRNRRCPRCKCIRKMWLRSNYLRPWRVLSKPGEPGEGKICWVCRIREKIPDWRPGRPIPEELQVDFV